MHNNYYFLRQLTPALDSLLKDTVISECFSQNRDELIIRFESKTTPLFIKASLEPAFTCLSFPSDFNRARKNSVDLFERAVGGKVIGTRQFANERSFAIVLSDDMILLFKMHGIRSNIILYEKGEVINLFRNNLPADETLDINTLDRTIDWGYNTFLAQRQKLQSLYFTFGKPVWKYLDHLNFHLLSPEQQWDILQQTRQQLEHPAYFITSADGNLILSLVNTGQVWKEFSDPIKAINEFFHAYTSQSAFIREKASAMAILKHKIQGSENYYQKTSDKLTEITKDNHYKVWADIIMANMHRITPGMEKITLDNFYNENQPIEIRLKKDANAQKNAEGYYRKAKNQHIEIQRLQDSLTAKEQEIKKLMEQVIVLEEVADLKSLRKVVGNQGPRQKEKQPPPLPYHEVQHNGFRIWVGKNAQHNDTLTFKFTYKDDLWLHAKDVAGSHVVIKHQANKPFPKDVIERAAQLAAFNSKRKTDTLCPVSVTPKKFVRKRKGDPAGAVVVEREEVIMVTPIRY